MNHLVFSPQYLRLYKKKKKGPRYILEMIAEATEKLEASPSPESLGPYKNGPLDGTLAYELTKKTRILYRVDRVGGECTVTFLRVCNHKDVYRKD